MSNRIIAIGDIHGCANALSTLIEAIQPIAEDTIIPLGDLVDRGADSKGAVDQVMALRERCQVILIKGNHEEMMLDVIKGTSPQEWLKHGGVSTLDSYGFSGDLSVVPPEHVEFLDAGLDYYESDTHIFTHGNYDPKLPMDEQSPMTLRWRSLIELTPPRHKSGKTAVLGHTPDKSGEIFDMGHLVCIDTYCYGGQWLTAFDVVNRKIWQANESGQLREAN